MPVDELAPGCRVEPTLMSSLARYSFGETRDDETDLFVIPVTAMMGNKHLGAGDVAILVERDQFRARTSFTGVTIWTLDLRLRPYS